MSDQREGTGNRQHGVPYRELDAVHPATTGQSTPLGMCREELAERAHASDALRMDCNLEKFPLVLAALGSVCLVLGGFVWWRLLQ